MSKISLEFFRYCQELCLVGGSYEGTDRIREDVDVCSFRAPARMLL